MSETERTPSGFARVAESVLLFGLGAVPLTVAWTVAGAHIALALAALGGMGLWIASRRSPLGATAARNAMLAFAAASVLATARSVDVAQSFVGLKKLLLLPTIPLVAGAFASPRRTRLGFRLLIAGVTVTACIAALRFELLPHALDARLRSTGHYMTFSGLLGLAWPLAAAAAVTTPGRRRWPYAAATLVLGAALLLTFTRGAWIGVVCASAAMLLRSRPRAALLVLPAAALALAVLPANYRERALSSFDPSHPFNADRLRLWRAGVAIWRDHPWTGVGLVDLKPLYLQYRQESVGVVHGHLHDNWLHVAVTLGSLGLAAFAWLMVSFGRLALGAGRNLADSELRGLASGAWGAFWFFQVMGLFEWNFGDVEVTIALYYLLGLAAGMQTSVWRAAALPRSARPLPAADPAGSEAREVQV